MNPAGQHSQSARLAVKKFDKMTQCPHYLGSQFICQSETVRIAASPPLPQFSLSLGIRFLALPPSAQMPQALLTRSRYSLS
jgi:hypothetical protein